MAHHHASRSAYDRLAERLNRFPQGAPPSDTLRKILAHLFGERDAALVAALPVRPFTAARAARAWSVPIAEARAKLDALADRALLLDVVREGHETRWVLPPPMAGFFEFSLMRVRGDLDQRALAELFHQYLAVEDEFLRALFAGGETQIGRVFVDETALRDDDALHVLDWERASEIVRASTARGVSLCYCRHKAEHLGRACDAPRDVCMTFGDCAASLVRHGHARAVDVPEALELLAAARERGLVQFGENVRQHPAFLCNCCGCCCEAMVAARRFAALHPIQTTHVMPVVDERACTGCERCVRACPVEAMAAVSANDPARPRRAVARVDEERCLGCAVCVRACRAGALRLRERAARTLTPVNAAHRVVLMALERGTLADLVFDGASQGQRTLAVLLGALLRLPPAKRALATAQVRSRALEALLRHVT